MFPNFFYTVWDAKVLKLQCSLCHLPSCHSLTVVAWRKGSHDKSIRNTLILRFSITWNKKLYVLFPVIWDVLQYMSTPNRWAWEWGGKGVGSPRHLVSALYQKSEKQCRKSLTELCSLPEKQWETNELMPTFTSCDFCNRQCTRVMNKLNAQGLVDGPS